MRLFGRDAGLALGPADAGLLALGLAGARGAAGGEGGEELSGALGHLLDGALEGLAIGGGGGGDAAHFSHELKGGVPDLALGGGRLEVVEDANVPAHAGEDTRSGAPYEVGARRAVRSRRAPQ